jgi:hypothetical protein
MPRFRPFETQLSKLTPADLRALRDVSEGWYIEYKREVPNAAAIAKSIGAFANHYGGWIFYGVDQTTDGTNRAGGFPGIPAPDVPKAMQRVTDAAAQALSPSPHFESTVLRGPDSTLELPADRALIVIEVPEGGDPPYIHSSGRIYRRVADRSDPREETDRSVLDLLWERGRKRRSILTEFLTRKPELDKSESSEPHARLFFVRDPLRDVAEGGSLKFDAFATIMRDTSRNPRIPFDNCYGSADGFVARQVANNSAALRGVTFEYTLGGTSVITFPLRRVEWKDYPQYSHANALQSIAEQHGWENAPLPLIDVGLLFTIMQATLACHWDLSAADGVSSRCAMKARLLNVGRLVPFLDSPAYLTFVESHGLPFILQRDVFAPPGASPESMLIAAKTATNSGTKGGDDGGSMNNGLIELLQHVLYALGLPFEVVQNSVEGFFEAIRRSTVVHSGRSDA